LEGSAEKVLQKLPDPLWPDDPAGMIGTPSAAVAGGEKQRKFGVAARSGRT
jgi:hypothetical protein